MTYGPVYDLFYDYWYPTSPVLVSPRLTMQRTAQGDTTGQPMDINLGNWCLNNGKTCLLFENSDSVSHSVAVFVLETIEGRGIDNAIIAVPAGGGAWAGRFDLPVFGVNLKMICDSPLVQVSVFYP